MLSFCDKYGVLQWYVYWLKMSQTWNSEELVKSALSNLHALRSRCYLLLSSSSVCDFLVAVVAPGEDVGDDHGHHGAPG